MHNIPILISLKGKTNYTYCCFYTCCGIIWGSLFRTAVILTPGACGPGVPWRGPWTRSAGSGGSGGSAGSADGFIFAHFSCFLQYFVIRTFQNHCKVVHFQFQRATLTVNGEGQCQKHIVKLTFSISTCNPYGKRWGSMSKTLRKIDIFNFSVQPLW